MAASSELTGMALDKAVVEVVWPDAWVHHWGGLRDGESCDVIIGHRGIGAVTYSRLGAGATEPEAWADAADKVIEVEGCEFYEERFAWRWKRGNARSGIFKNQASAKNDAKQDYVQRHAQAASEPAMPAVSAEPDSQVGPKIGTTRSCFDCSVCRSDSYKIQGDSGFSVYCDHPNAPTKPKNYIGDSHWTTPDWCPVLNPSQPTSAPELSDEEYDYNRRGKPYTCPECGTKHREARWAYKSTQATESTNKPTLESVTTDNRSRYSKAVDFSHRLQHAEGDEYASAISDLADMLYAQALIPALQMNAADNYAASESRLHAEEEESKRLRQELAKDDDRLFAGAKLESVAQQMADALEDVADGMNISDFDPTEGTCAKVLAALAAFKELTRHA